ncbi:unnamed protein product [Camellia sinensis]
MLEFRRLQNAQLVSPATPSVAAEQHSPPLETPPRYKRPSKRPKLPLGLGSSFPSKPATTPHHFEPDFTTNYAFPS